jgi:hypothetical protein
MMNINVSSRKCAVRVAPTCADERITVVVSPEQARVRDAAFEAAYRAAGMEAHLTTLLVEARDAQERLKGDVKSFLFLDRAIVALEKAHAKLGKENEPIYRAAEEAGERWGICSTMPTCCSIGVRPTTGAAAPRTMAFGPSPGHKSTVCTPKYRRA